MSRTIRVMIVAVVLLGTSRAHGQTQVMGVPVGAPVGQPDCGPASRAAAYGTPACTLYEDNNGPLLKGDPLLDGRLLHEFTYGAGPTTPGWFWSVEASAAKPHVNERMFAQILPDFPATSLGNSGFHLPFAEQDWTVSPVVQVGYRFGQAAGEMLLNYQYLGSSGSGLGTDAFGNPASLQSRLIVNSGDVEYASREFSLGPICDMKWLVGVRVGSVFFDSHVESAAAQQSISNNYVGAGPVFGLNLSRSIADTGVDLFCRTECALLFGPVTQNFDAGGGAIVQQQHNNLVVVPKVEGGIGWTPSWYRQLHFAAGYTFQYWSNIAEYQTFANTNNLPISRGDLMIQGIFGRIEWNF